MARFKMRKTTMYRIIVGASMVASVGIAMVHGWVGWLCFVPSYFVGNYWRLAFPRKAPKI